ncbi:MAG: GIY-YIG nuclease family protein [Alphaproteobacteria bacterium]|nr:GIY-YIG nuclease family protein [Alphaproteobacteria bacterium]
MRQPTVYMMASKQNGTIYTGVTSDLVKRVYEHKNQITKGFTSKYSCKILVYYESHGCMESAITREKKIKGGSRSRKITLIETANPSWRDLYADIV